MLVFVPTDVKLEVDQRRLFWPARLFYRKGEWGNHEELYQKWSVDMHLVQFTAHIGEADLMVLPYTVNDYVRFGYRDKIREYSQLCVHHQVRGYAGIAGDFGARYPEYKGLVYFRMGGFRSQLGPEYEGMPFALSDQLPVFSPGGFQPRPYQARPMVGFCGHATRGLFRLVQESGKFLFENVKRAFANPIRSDWEPVFLSAFQRASLLRSLEQHPGIETNFIYRARYRAGASTPAELHRTTQEYYANILSSDYILCVRGGGNFSVRLYETLMMGRIPVFVNTDCLLPFDQWVDWKKHVVWVEWHERGMLAEKVLAFHRTLDPYQFQSLQLLNRQLWERQLTMGGMFDYFRWRHEQAEV
ncbi:MAG: exostosin family protein [Cyclobacteriaceae bacterium]|nr:exostosin family protein [Cyclobacteriaceae bacterium]